MNEHAEQKSRERQTALRGAARLVVGRLREQSILRAQLAATLAGDGGLVILSGEAGIGKTTLAEELCQEAINAGALVLVGHCYDGAETAPYGPWAELLDQHGALRNRSLDPRTNAEPNLANGSSQGALFAEMRDFFASIARERPLVLLLDDMHWADTESFDLLRFVARQLVSAPILLLINYRNEAVTRAHPLYRLVPLLVRESLAVRIDVNPLGEEEVRTLIDRAYRLPADDVNRLATYLQQRAEGNPFFVRELLRSLEGTALLATASGSWTLGALDRARIPVLLRQVIDQRLAEFGTQAEGLLAVAAVIGHVAPLALWAKVSDVSEETILLLVERAVRANIMDATDDGLATRFTHALFREALYDSVLPPRRRVWHRQIGEGMLALHTDPDPDELAYHFNQAGDRRAIEWLARAGERAQRAFAWRTASLRFGSALALLGNDDTASNERGWLRFRLALLRRFEDPGAGITELEEAERLGQAAGDGALVAYARFHQGMLRCQRDDFRLGIAAEEAGIALLDALAPAERARLESLETTSDPLDAQNGRGELTLALAENGRLRQARALGEHIISLPPAQTIGSRGDAYYGLGYTYAALGQPEAARRSFARAREIFAAADYRSMVTASLFDELIVVTVPYFVDRPHERLRVETELSASFAALHEVFDQGSADSAQVVSAVLGGAWPEALAMLEQSKLSFMRRATPTLLAPIARHQGNAALAWALVRMSFPAGAETAPEDSALDAMPLRALAVTLALDEGDWNAARQWLASFDHWLEWSGSVFGQADAHLCWAALHSATGEHEQARERVSEALAAAGAPRQPLALLAAHRLLGELDLAAGRLTDAEEQLAAALTLAETCGARHEQALTLLMQADLLRARGHLPDARVHLDTVRSLCIPMKATLTLAQADALEARLATASLAVAPKLPAGLTPREAEVLRLLATGLTNAEIAAELFVSPRTIDTHLTSIYDKLGVTTRGAAIRFALEHELG